ncbi:phosphoribosylanthranilate isomerase [Aquimarina sp. I32.4]|uniref:phosphoribosylanthranilate isomerase n=1 Tax=Aquimarina sp. I32.4 TaxID=2053903 RepID=UPI000CDE720E|nr:phosphoribosylanthranilate isomerase [Aquimarina sp. I32.4]
MKFSENIQEVTLLQPDYLGFIFYPKSPRNFEGDIPTIPSSIKKVGVFVNASIDYVIEKVKQYDFKAIQLHGNESPVYCQELKTRCQSISNTKSNIEQQDQIKIWKVFSIKDSFDFSILTPYEAMVDYFLFDTKGKEKGGNGYTFDWSLLEGYPATTPFILSGGIGLDQIEAITSFMSRPESNYLYAIDVNSKFENAPGIKNIDDLEKFKKRVISQQT